MRGSRRATRVPQESVPRLGQAPIGLTCLGFGWVRLRGLALTDPIVARCRESIAFRNSLLVACLYPTAPTYPELVDVAPLDHVTVVVHHHRG